MNYDIDGYYTSLSNKKLTRIITILFFLIMTLVLVALPITFVHLNLPYDLIDLGVFFPLAHIMLNLLYLIDNKFNMTFHIFKPRYYSCFPVRRGYTIYKELCYLLRQWRYIIFITASCFLFFYLTIFKAEWIDSLMGTLAFLFSLFLLLLLMVLVKNRFKNYKILIHFFNLQIILFYIPLVTDNSYVSWFFSIGNILAHNLLFTSSVFHTIALILCSVIPIFIVFKYHQP